MKNLLPCIIAAAAVLVGSAVAKPATPPPAPAEKTTPVQMTMVDIQVAAIAIANAGAGCDQKVESLCQILAVRGPTLIKLQAALQALTAPRAAAPAKK